MTQLDAITRPEIMRFADLLDYQRHQTVSKTLIGNDAVRMILYALDREEEIPAHTSRGKIVALVLEGKALVSIMGEPFHLCAGETIVIPAGMTHLAYAVDKVKILLTIIH